jgi:hypothetical protein
MFTKTVDFPLSTVSAEPLTIVLEQFDQQRDRWPGHGKHIVGVFSSSAFLLYQAFNDQIADYAVANQKFEGAPGYSESRMTWTKPNFLWMMYRSNWAKRANQTRILGLWLKLDSFHELLQSTRKTIDKGKDTKHGASSSGAVTIQWDPDHTPNGDEMTKRALQIGVKSVSWWKTGERFEGIVDMTPLVVAIRDHAKTKNGLYPKLFIPQEKLYLLPSNLTQIVSTDTSELDLKAEQDFFDEHVPTAIKSEFEPLASNPAST